MILTDVKWELGGYCGQVLESHFRKFKPKLLRDLSPIAKCIE